MGLYKEAALPPSDLTIVVMSFDTLRTLIQSVVVEFLLSELVPEARFQSATEGSKLQLVIGRSGGRCFAGVRCHHNFIHRQHGQVLQAVK